MTEHDIAALRAVDPAMLIPSRIPRMGHAVLLDNPHAAAVLRSLLVPTSEA